MALSGQHKIDGGLSFERGIRRLLGYPHIYCQSLSPFYFTGSQTWSTYILLFRSIIYFYSYGFYIGFPHFIGPSMGMAYFISKVYAFSTNGTFCHHCTSSILFSTICLFYQKNFIFARESEKIYKWANPKKCTKIPFPIMTQYRQEYCRYGNM